MRIDVELSSQFSSSDESEQSRSPLNRIEFQFKDFYIWTFTDSQTNVLLIQKWLVLHWNKSADWQFIVIGVRDVVVRLAKWFKTKSKIFFWSKWKNIFCWQIILHACGVSSSLKPSAIEQSLKLSQTLSNRMHRPVDEHLKYPTGHVTFKQSNGSSAPSSKFQWKENDETSFFAFYLSTYSNKVVHHNDEKLTHIFHHSRILFPDKGSDIFLKIRLFN